jgi:rod shape-determining protein MreB
MIFSQDIGIDLGTSNTAVCVKGKGVIYHEPSVVSVDAATNEKTVRAVGHEAQTMIGRTPGSVLAIRPIREGVIADYTATSEMIRHYIKKAIGKSLLVSARVMISVPAGATEVERRAVHMAAREAGARYVSLIEGPMAAAIGAGLSVMKPDGRMIVDIGGGSTQVAVVSLGDEVTVSSVKIGGEALDKAIVSYFAAEYNMLIGSTTAENVKIKIGSACEYLGEANLDVRGRDLTDGLPKSIEVSSAQIRIALEEPLSKIIALIKSTIEKTPPELVADILDNGIVLTGGTAHLRGIADLIHNEVGVPVTVAENPQECIIQGILYCLENNDAKTLG